MRSKVCIVCGRPWSEHKSDGIISIDAAELASLRKNSERWEWFLRNGLQPAINPYPHFELSHMLRQFSYVSHIELHIDEMIQREKT